MKILLTILSLALSGPAPAQNETATEIAKRVIADKSSATTSSALGKVGNAAAIISADVRNPKDDQLAESAKKADAAMDAFMLGESVPEKVRVAYALRILASKRIPNPRRGGVPDMDERKNEGYLKDGIILAARLAEIENAEQSGGGQPATRTEPDSQGGDKPRPKPEGRSR